jgi:hypothetical protein
MQSAIRRCPSLPVTLDAAKTRLVTSRRAAGADAPLHFDGGPVSQALA